jgi:hypothetical protein
MRRLTSRTLLLVCIATGAGAQSASTIKLKPAAAKIDAEFSSIVAVRELADGRALVADLTENKVVVVDFASGTVSQIGRSGQGPGEYQNPRWFFRLGDDSTLLMEQRTSRWHLLKGAAVVGTIPADDPVYSAFQRQVLGADARGHVIRSSAFADNKSASIPANGPDSLWVLRANRKSARIDTLTRVKAQKSQVTTTTNARGEVTGVSILMAPFSAPEQPAMFEDGWVAIARVEPYRVDWISPDNKMTNGRPLPWPVTKLTEKDLEFMYASRGGKAPTTPEQVAARRQQLDAQMKLLPAALPPFAVQALIPAEDGTLLLRHNETAGQPTTRYDLVDRSGRLRGTIAMDKGETIAAVSKKWAYVVYVDDDGLNFLRRHPWQSISVAP